MGRDREVIGRRLSVPATWWGTEYAKSVTEKYFRVSIVKFIIGKSVKEDRWVIRDDGTGQEDSMAWSAVTAFMQLDSNAAAGPSVPSTTGK
jgi:hypothetical protein